MASIFMTSSKNDMLTGITTGTFPANHHIVTASLHTADPGTTGTSEVTGGSPAYARKAITFNASSGGAVASAADVTFDVPAATTIAYIGFWDNQGSPVFRAKADVTDEVFAGQGTYKINAGSTFTLADS